MRRGGRKGKVVSLFFPAKKKILKHGKIAAADASMPIWFLPHFKSRTSLPLFAPRTWKLRQGLQWQGRHCRWPWS